MAIEFAKRRSLCLEKTGLTESQLCVVVGAMAAEKVGDGPVTQSAVCAMTGSTLSSFQSLVRGRWLVMSRSKIPRTYRATPRAWLELGIER